MSTVRISGAPPGRVADGGPIPSKTGFKTNNEGFAKTAKIAMNSGDEQMAVSEATLGPDTGWKPMLLCPSRRMCGHRFVGFIPGPDSSVCMDQR
jgi:hypothetical protein